MPPTVTVTSTTPADPAGETAVSEVVLQLVGVAAAVGPNVTVFDAHVALKLVPVITTLVPPAIGPTVGETAVTVGVAWSVKITPAAPTIQHIVALAQVVPERACVVPEVSAVHVVPPLLVVMISPPLPAAQHAVVLTHQTPPSPPLPGEV
jgi:hypothetical protein